MLFRSKKSMGWKLTVVRDAETNHGSLISVRLMSEEKQNRDNTWGYSSAGRAPALQAGGQRFDPVYLHQKFM